MVPAFAVADRSYTATLRSIRGERLGRFSLRRGERPGHCWEWLGHPWPDDVVFMVPDPRGRAFDEGVGDLYPAEPQVAPVADPVETHARLASADRLYALHRLDGHEQPLGLLAVSGRRLIWLERGAGGFHALAPALIRFTPQATLDGIATGARLLVQRALPAGSGLLSASLAMAR